MKPDHAWVLLPSGKRLDLLTPDPSAWTDRDLAISLSRTYRWGGHSRWELPLSVAQHSLLVLVMRQKMNALQPLSRADALRELLHHAEEGFLCFDPISPLKPHLGEGFNCVSNRLRAAIANRYDIQPWEGAGYLLHKQARSPGRGIGSIPRHRLVAGRYPRPLAHPTGSRGGRPAAPRGDAAVGAVAATHRGRFVPGQAARTDA
jgi:hypothetical protein